MQKYIYFIRPLMICSLLLFSIVVAQQTIAQTDRTQQRKLFMEGVNAFQEKKYDQAKVNFEQLSGQYSALQDYVQFFLGNTLFRFIDSGGAATSGFYRVRALP